MIIQPDKELNKFVVVGPGFQVVISTILPYDDYCKTIFKAIEENVIIILRPMNSEENTVFFRSSPNQITVLNVLTEKEFDKMRREQQYNQARAEGHPGSRIMRNQ